MNMPDAFKKIIFHNLIKNEYTKNPRNTKVSKPFSVDYVISKKET